MSWSRGVNKCIFKFKRAPIREKPNLPIFICYIHGFLMIRDSNLFFAKKIHGLQTSSNARKNKFTNFRVLQSMNFLRYVIPSYFLPKIFMDVRYDLINGVGWFRGANKRIFKFKQAPM
ncbi:hypothetical protein H5410_034920 [Solanum commersonii]|uniref:Uncharacterized protein n=1 Tax=Solanum commersonii TaxID=4109 RepID=A0A9J5Y2B8_SOLCO|nr:hypothetical protein H5410_034920 [Solanum commersonii]